MKRFIHVDSPDIVVLFVMNIDHGMHRRTTADEDETRPDRPYQIYPWGSCPTIGVLAWQPGDVYLRRFGEHFRAVACAAHGHRGTL